MGDWEETILLTCRREGRELPQEVQDAPEVALGLEFYWDSFVDLNTCRQSGMGLGPIPWTSILQYANENDVQGIQRQALFHHVRSMDLAFLRYNKSKEKK